MSSGRIRVSVDSVPLVIQPGPEEIERFAAAGRGELVSEVRATRSDRSGGIRRFEVVVDGWLFDASTEAANRAELRERVAKGAAAHQPTSGVTLRAQIPGRVVRLWVAEGEAVERGQRLMAVEAMKMENEIRAPQAGTVERINIALGDTVEKHDELLSLS
ncbi:MAG: biotin/lipoyl-containing protein [Candidatus Limnocylindrales bacterium]